VKEQAAETIPYHHRWWFPEEGYRATTWSNFFNRLVNGRLLEQWYEFTDDRIPKDTLGALDGEALLPAPATASRG
jgi:hypothetical protein